MESAFQYIKENDGDDTEESYPYKAEVNNDKQFFYNYLSILCLIINCIYMYVQGYEITLLYHPHWSALVGNNHLSDELTTSQIIHIQATETVLSINWINSTKCNVNSNHHSKYPGQNTDHHLGINYVATNHTTTIFILLQTVCITIKLRQCLHIVHVYKIKMKEHVQISKPKKLTNKIGMVPQQHN